MENSAGLYHTKLFLHWHWRF